MVIRSIEGDDEINKLLNKGMLVTVRALVSEGSLSQEAGEKFLDGHICLFAPREGGFSYWLKRLFGKDGDWADGNSKILVAKINR